MSDTSELMVVSNKLTLDDINSLIDKEKKTLAIWVKGYIAKDVCSKITNTLTQKNLFEKYSFYSEDIPVGRLGMAFGETCLDASLEDEYFAQSSEMRTLIRDIASPYLSPIDKLMLDLDTLWPKGATTPEMYGKRMLSGTYRSVMPGGKITPHQDNLEEELPNADFIPLRDLASNVYVEIPENSGGEFQVWDFSPEYSHSLAEYYNDSLSKDDHHLSEEDYQQLDHLPSITIKPDIGDLIIFNPINVHQVNELRDGMRITSSFHIGYMGQDKQLFCWS